LAVVTQKLGENVVTGGGRAIFVGVHHDNVREEILRLSGHVGRVTRGCGKWR